MNQLTFYPKYHIFDNNDHNLTHLYNPLDQISQQYIVNFFAAKQLAILEQEHSDRIHYVDLNYKIQVGDAMISDVPGVILGIKTADCVGVLMASSDQKVIAAMHLGWRGAISELIYKTMNLIKQFSNAQVQAIISPCIRKLSYEVDNNFFLNFTKYKATSVDFFEIVDNKLFFDLPEFIKYELKQCDVSNIYDTKQNTYDSDKYFSYRKAQHNGINQPRRILSCITL